jgi:hypothetical protein
LQAPGDAVERLVGELLGEGTAAVLEHRDEPPAQLQVALARGFAVRAELEKQRLERLATEGFGHGGPSPWRCRP